MAYLMHVAPVCREDYQFTNWQRRLAKDQNHNIVHVTVHEAKCRGLVLLPAKQALFYRELARDIANRM